MDYLDEAKKFIQLARCATHPEVIDQNLKMAEWCLAEAVEERRDAPAEESRNPK